MTHFARFNLLFSLTAFASLTLGHSVLAQTPSGLEPPVSLVPATPDQVKSTLEQIPFIPQPYQLAAYINENPVYRFVEAPGSPFNERCNEAAEAGDYNKVLAITREWRQAEPDSAAAAFNQGSALFYLGHFAEAIPAWKKAGDVQPDLVFSVQRWTRRSQKILAQFPNLVLPPAKWKANEDEATRDAMNKKARTLLAAKKWDEIEKEADALLKSHIELPDGSWQLTWFFGGLWSSGENPQTELTWRKQRDAIAAWNTARPKSALAKLVLARSWTDGAWLARGTRTADKTADESFARMEERLRYASSYFKDSSDLISKTPLWTAAFQKFSFIAGVDNESYDAIINEATKHFPTYSNFAANKATRLEPRWAGEPGEWERYAKAKADNVAKVRGAVEGDILYARILWAVEVQYDYPNLWKESAASWPRAKRGFEALLRRYPKSHSVASRASQLAWQARDFKFAQPLLLTIIGGQADNQIWNDLEDFNDFRIDIIENGAVFRFPLN